MGPRVSVLLPFRDAAGTVAEAIASIRAQTLDGWELVAVDDRSTDGSREIVAAAAREDERIRLLRAEGEGLVAALQTGMKAARAPLLARMDADDLMLPDRLRRQTAELERRPELDLVGCRVELFPPAEIRAGYREYVRWQNEVISPADVADERYVESPFAHPSVAFRVEAVRAAGGYREGAFPEDYELWLRMLERGSRMAKIPQVLLRWRERGGRTSRTDPRYSREAFDGLRAEFLSRDRRLREGRGLVVWGAGRRTRVRAELLLGRGFDPIAWIDIDPAKFGRTIRGAVVHPPEWLARRPRPFVLVYVTAHGARERIAGRLRELGYERGTDWLAVG